MLQIIKWLDFCASEDAVDYAAHEVDGDDHEEDDAPVDDVVMPSDNSAHRVGRNDSRKLGGEVGQAHEGPRKVRRDVDVIYALTGVLWNNFLSPSTRGNFTNSTTHQRPESPDADAEEGDAKRLVPVHEGQGQQSKYGSPESCSKKKEIAI